MTEITDEMVRKAYHAYEASLYRSRDFDKAMRAALETAALASRPAQSVGEEIAQIAFDEQVAVLGDEKAHWGLAHRIRDRVLTLLSSPAKTDEWQPIETAPKDGTAVLVVVPTANNVFIGAWRTWESECRRGLVTAWWSNGAKNAYQPTQLILNPTHWMPLPAPPAPDKTEG